MDQLGTLLVAGKGSEALVMIIVTIIIVDRYVSLLVTVKSLKGLKSLCNDHCYHDYGMNLAHVRLRQSKVSMITIVLGRKKA